MPPHRRGNFGLAFFISYFSLSTFIALSQILFQVPIVIGVDCYWTSLWRDRKQVFKSGYLYYGAEGESVTVNSFTTNSQTSRLGIDAKRSGKRTEERMTAQSLSFVVVGDIYRLASRPVNMACYCVRSRRSTAISFPPPFINLAV